MCFNVKHTCSNCPNGNAVWHKEERCSTNCGKFRDVSPASSVKESRCSQCLKGEVARVQVDMRQQGISQLQLPTQSVQEAQRRGTPPFQPLGGTAFGGSQLQPPAQSVPGAQHRGTPPLQPLGGRTLGGFRDQAGLPLPSSRDSSVDPRTRVHSLLNPSPPSRDSSVESGTRVSSSLNPSPPYAGDSASMNPQQTIQGSSNPRYNMMKRKNLAWAHLGNPYGVPTLQDALSNEGDDDSENDTATGTPQTPPKRRRRAASTQSTQEPPDEWSREEQEEISRLLQDRILPQDRYAAFKHKFPKTERSYTDFSSKADTLQMKSKILDDQKHGGVPKVDGRRGAEKHPWTDKEVDIIVDVWTNAATAGKKLKDKVLLVNQRLGPDHTRKESSIKSKAETLKMQGGIPYGYMANYVWWTNDETNELQQIYKDNPGRSVPEKFKLFKDRFPNTQRTEDAFRKRYDYLCDTNATQNFHLPSGGSEPGPA